MRKVILFIFCVCFSVSNIFGQNQLIHEQKLITGDDGKVYLNKALPVYFKISNSRSTNSEKFLVESQEHPQYTNPMYFAKEGLNTVYSPSAVDTVTLKPIMPKQNVYFQIYVDGIAPVTSVHNNSTPYEKKDTLYFGLNLKIKFDVIDKVSGLDKTYYSIDGSEFKEFSTELTFDKEKEYILKYYSVDKVGNVEAVKEVKFTIDASKPLTNLKIFGNYIDNIISGTSSISLKPEDAFAGTASTYYILDKNEKQIYSVPLLAKTLYEGEHTLTYYTTDNVFNEEENKVYNFYVDKTAPILLSEILGDSFFANGKEYSSGRSKLKLTAIDNRAGVKEIYYTTNGKDYILYDKPFYLPNQSGNIDIKFYAVDNVGNKTSEDATNSANKLNFNSYIDLVGPELSYKFDGKTYTFNDTTYITSSTKIILKGFDSEAGMKNITYNLDQSSETDYTSVLTVSGNGLHQIDYYGYDNVNNSNLGSFTFKVDETAPEITAHFSLNSSGKKIVDSKEFKIYPQQLIVYLSAFDDMVGVEKIYYTIEGQPEKLYTNFISTFQMGKDYKIKLRAIDYLGNESISEIYFSIAG